MRKPIVVGALVSQALLVVLLALGLRTRLLPLGVPGQWEWLRVSRWPEWPAPLFAILAVAGYAGLAALGWRRLAGRAASSRIEEAAWVAVLLFASVVVQVGVMTGAADEYDLTKWAYVNFFSSSTGYYEVAREQVAADPAAFLADYPRWIQSQDSLHIGTHPPGLFLVHAYLLNTMTRHPSWAASLLDLAPGSTSRGFRQLEQMARRPLPRTDRAALFLAGLLTLLACSATVVPLYLLVRAERSASASWAAATLWPLAPSAILFQPVADTTYPFLASLAIASAAWASRVARRSMADGPPHQTRSSVGYRCLGPGLAALSGVVLALGMWCSLVFLAVGLIVALVYATTPSTPRQRIALVASTGASFLAVTLLAWGATRANPFSIWWWNQFHHARFYDDYPRSYRAWFVANPIEFAVAIGLPSLSWLVAGLPDGWRRVDPENNAAPAEDERTQGRAGPEGRLRLLRTAVAGVAVLVLLNLIGRNKGEVARLWMPFMPPVLGAAGSGFERAGGGALALAATIVLLGLQTLILEWNIQVVYPV
jgi:hypothetical protein